MVIKKLSARSGDIVTVIGNPLGFENIVIRGVIGSYFRISDYPVPVFDIKAPIHPGNSGSPVFNNNGQVIGVVFGSIRNEKEGTTETRGLAIPIREIMDFLSHTEETKKKVPFWKKIEIASP